MKQAITEYISTTYRMMSEQKLLLSFLGDITPETTNHLLRSIKNDKRSFEQEAISKKKVYNVAVECLENIDRHAGIINDKQHPSLFLLGKDEESYYVLTGNYIDNRETGTVREILDGVNALDKEEVKEKYREALLEGSLSEKGGAGLGIIDMALKSGNKLEYEFISAEEISFYILKIQVPRILEKTALI